MATLPLIIPGMLHGKYLIYLSKKSHKEYGKANTIVEKALSSIKTVYSFTAERRIIEGCSGITSSQGYEVPYSEHCSFTELKEFVKVTSPDNIIPSVNNDGPESANAMISLLLS